MFILDSNDATPLYKQLYKQIREQVLSGKLEADSKLPSVRALANELSISCNTVEGGYQELCAKDISIAEQTAVTMYLQIAKVQ